MLFFSLHVDYKQKRFTYYIYLISTQLGLYSFVSFIVYMVQTILGVVGTNGDCNYSITQISERVIITPQSKLCQKQQLSWSIYLDIPFYHRLSSSYFLFQSIASSLERWEFFGISLSDSLRLFSIFQQVWPYCLSILNVRLMRSTRGHRVLETSR